MGELGKVAYLAYGDVTGWKNYQGLPMPTWANLPQGIRDAWNAAARAVLEDANSDE